MLYKIFDGVIENNPYESEIEFIEEEITNIKHKIQLCNEALNDKKKKLKEIERKCKIKQREIEYNKWINELEIKQEYDMLKLAKQQIFLIYLIVYLRNILIKLLKSQNNYLL